MCGRTLPGLTSQPCPRADLQLPSLDGVGAPGAPALASGRPSGLWPPHACEALGPGFFPQSKGMGEVSTAPNLDDGEERSRLSSGMDRRFGGQAARVRSHQGLEISSQGKCLCFSVRAEG